MKEVLLLELLLFAQEEDFLNVKGDQKNPKQTSSNSRQDAYASQDLEKCWDLTMDVKYAWRIQVLKIHMWNTFKVFTNMWHNLATPNAQYQVRIKKWHNLATSENKEEKWMTKFWQMPD
mgnify:CR=1 FL=1